MSKLILICAITALMAACTSGPPVAPETKQIIERATAADKETSDFKIWEALRAAEQDARRYGADFRSKTVGGLSCTKMTPVVIGGVPKYSCVIGPAFDAGAIYESLNVGEEDLRSIDEEGHPLGQAKVYGKSAGRLSCRKSIVTKDKAEYNCYAAF